MDVPKVIQLLLYYYELQHMLTNKVINSFELTLREFLDLNSLSTLYEQTQTAELFKLVQRSYAAQGVTWWQDTDLACARPSLIPNTAKHKL